MDYGENIFLLLNYHRNKLYYSVKRLTMMVVIIGVILILMIPVTVLITENVIDSRELWEVTGKHELDRYSVNKTGQNPYWLTVKRENVLIDIEVPWDIYLNVDVGDKVRLDPNCENVIGLIKS